MEEKPAIQYLKEELDKTTILSDEFKTRLFAIASTVAEDAYNRGKDEGFKLGETVAQGPNITSNLPRGKPRGF